MADVQRASRMPVPRFLACLITAIGLNGTVAAQTWSLDETPPRFSSYSDFGGVGLLQMPSARMAPDGEFAVSSGVVTPYVRTAVTLQALPGLEAVLRYTSVNNRLYGPESFSGDQSYKDKGIDVKFRLLEESSAFPQLVV
ncbi:MAG: YjbH domain-containing protein, partial [Azonexus sp.]|nr:YjbH domain-containing protein [Azonexus sp.]